MRIKGARRRGGLPGGEGKHGVGKTDAEDRVEIAAYAADAGEDRHIRGGSATCRPVRRVAQDAADVALQRQVAHREPCTVAPSTWFRRGVDAPPAALGEVPEVVGVAGDHFDGMTGRDEPPDDRPAVILGAADARMIAMGEPGDAHCRSLLGGLPPASRVAASTIRVDMFTFSRSCGTGRARNGGSLIQRRGSGVPWPSKSFRRISPTSGLARRPITPKWMGSMKAEGG